MKTIEKMEGDRDKEENLIKGFPLNEEYNQLREEHGKALSLLNTAINSKIVQFVSDHIFDLVPEPMIGCIYNIKSQRSAYKLRDTVYFFGMEGIHKQDKQVMSQNINAIINNVLFEIVKYNDLIFFEIYSCQNLKIDQA